jgi:hypothetical protein
MYATRGDLRQHITKVHRCGVYANIPAGGLSIRQRPYSSSSSKNSQRSLSPTKPQIPRRETVYRCSLCRSKFSHVRAIERHHYDIHHIDPFDVEAMKNATVEEEEEIDNEHLQSNTQHQQQEEMNNRDEDEQMAIIQFRNTEQSPLIVKLERGFLKSFDITYLSFFLFV